MSVQLRPYQSEAVNLVRVAYAQKKRAPLLVLPTGGGKCLGKGTPVLMFDGSVKPVEAVNDNDLLMGPDSAPRRVVSVCSGREMLYRVTPTKGETYTVNESHILSLKITGTTGRTTAGDGNKYGAGDVANIGVTQYLASSSSFKHVAKGWRVGVDFPKPANDNYPLPPYIMGVWLGDGNSRGPEICNVDPEVVQAWSDYAESIGHRVVVLDENRVPVYRIIGPEGGQLGRGHHRNQVRNALRSLGVLLNKHIPLQYKVAPRAQRLELLAGIIDTDGYLHHGHYDLVVKQEQFARDICFVARSLGLAAYFKPCRKTCTNTGACGDYWRLSISGELDEIPCRVPRRIAAPRQQKKSVTMTGITVEPIGIGEYFGFEIEGPDRLFLLGDFTVTHNTTIFSYVTASAVARDRVVFLLCHRAELVKQIAATLARFGCLHQIIAPGPIIRQAQIAQFKAHGRSYVHGQAKAVVASVQTLVRRLDDNTMPKPDLIVVDEAHHLTSDSTWGRIVEAYPDAKILPVTATPIRLDGKGLGIGAGGFADDLVMGPSMSWLIENGYLSPYRVFAPPSSLDLTGVRTRMGDYAKDQLASAMDKPSITGDSVQHYQRLAHGKRAVAFCVSVEHAKHVATEFKAAGVPAEFLDGTLDAMERERIIARFEVGQTLVLSSCDIVSEGFDLPAIEVAILLRPTKSLALYLQQVGRALRVFPGKAEAIILDHVGAVATHGLPDEDREWSLEGVKRGQRKTANDNDEEAVDRIQTCPQCFSVHLPAAECPSCGHVYPPKERKIEQTDGELVELSAEQMEAMRRQKRLAQGSAQTVEQLMAQGIGRFQAQKIVQAREEKAALRLQVMDGRAALGLSTRDILQAKPKQLRDWVARLDIRESPSISVG